MSNTPPPSYKGETQVAHCGHGHYTEIPGESFQRSSRDPYWGFCPKCECMVEWEPVSGPVMVIPS